jgi:hypothetical protein
MVRDRLDDSAYDPPGRQPDDCIEMAARYLATEPDAVNRALDVHSATSDGRCGGCGYRAVRWPCAVATIARRAFAMLAER